MTITPLPPPLTTAEVADLAGVTYRQVDHWARTGLLGAHLEDAAHGSGSRRAWRPADVYRVLAVAHLRRAGVNLDTTRTRLIAALDILDTIDRPRGGYLIVDEDGARIARTAATATAALVLPLAALTDNPRREVPVAAH